MSKRQRPGKAERVAKRAAIDKARQRHYARQAGLPVEPNDDDLGSAWQINPDGGGKLVPARLCLEGRSTSHYWDGEKIKGRIHSDTIHIGTNFQRHEIDRGIGHSLKGSSKSRKYRNGSGVEIQGSRQTNSGKGSGADLTIAGTKSNKARSAILKNARFHAAQVNKGPYKLNEKKIGELYPGYREDMKKR